MHLSALLDFHIVPLDTDDAVSVLLDITAPEREQDTERPPTTLQVVLDRSGSMRGDRLNGAVKALQSLVSRLSPTDNFGLVSFDDKAVVEVPAGPLTDRDAVRRRIGALEPGGTTDMSSGLMRGVQEARRVAGEQGATLLLISDGHANQGITDHEQLGRIAHDAYQYGVTITTLGYGLNYDEVLLRAVADGGAGSALFAWDPDTAGGLIAQEAEYLLAKTAQTVSVRVPGSEYLSGQKVVGELPANELADGSLMVELGDFYSGESRRLLLRLEVPGLPDLGTVTITTLEATYVDPASLTTYTATLPVSVNVVPGDEAAGRVPEPEVRGEEALQRAQTAKREASDALRRGDSTGASSILDHARRNLDSLAGSGGASADLAEQSAELQIMAKRALDDDADRAAKTAMSSSSGFIRRRQSRQDLPGDYRSSGQPGQPGRSDQQDQQGQSGQQGTGGNEIRGQQTNSDKYFPDDGPQHRPPRS